MLGKKIINPGAVACTTDTTQILDGGTTQSTALYRFEDNANDTASSTGKFNKGAVFNGSNSQILLTNSFDSALGNNNFSYSFWINGPMTSTNKIWYSFAQNYFIYLGYFSSQIYISLYNDTFSTSVTISANTWTHIAFVKSSTAGITIYKDGVSAYTSTTSAATGNLGTLGNGQVNVIGRYSGSGYDFDGKLDQVRFFNKAISASEVTTLYNETTSTTNTLQILGDTSCLAAYTFEGNANDLSTNYNGIASNVIYDYSGTASNVTYAAGKFGKAGVFNGSNSKITFSNDFDALNDFSVSLWFNTASISVHQYFYYFSNYGVFIDTSGYINYYGNSNLQYTTAVSLNTWYNVVFVKSSTAGKKIYLNGVEVATDTDTGNLPASFPTYSRSLIGAGIYNASTDWRFFNGKLDQFRVFDKVLSSGEVNSLYNETTTTAALGTISNPSTVAYYKMQDATDETGSYNGTASNVDFNIQGKYGFAGKFNGSNSLIAIGSPIPNTDTNVTISAWVKLNSGISGHMHITGTGITTSASEAPFRATLQYQSANTFRLFALRQVAGTYYLADNSTLTNVTMNADVWYHVVWSYNATGRQLSTFLNGTAIDSNKAMSTSGSSVNNSTTVIGSFRSTSGPFFDGKIDQVRFFNKVISADEVTKLYNEIQCADTITTPESYFNTKIYNGNGGTHTLTGVGFAPDFLWIKRRNGVTWHNLSDSIRGASKSIFSNDPYQEVDDSGGNRAKSFTSDGFTLNGNNGDVNASGGTYVAWNWKSGGILNQSASFNGSNGYIDTGLNQNVGNNFTWSLWFNSDISDSNYRLLIDKTNTSSPYPGAGIALQGGNVYGMINGTGGNLTYTGNSYNINQWYHVALTSNGSTVKLYLNSVEVGTGSVSTTNTSQNILIGDSTTWTTNYDGLINQVRIFNKEASSSEITTLYNETSSTINTLQVLGDTSCVAAYPLGTNANDLSTNYNGTALNITFNQPGHLNRNTNGTIESTVSASQESGFSIVKYTATGTIITNTVGHGLTTKPSLIIQKGLGGGMNWFAITDIIDGSFDYLMLNSNAAKADMTGGYANFSIDDTTFTNWYSNTSGDVITYCFANVDGYQRIGSYTGNGSANGPSVYTGFEPAFVMIKRTDVADNWLIFDQPRNTALFPNDSSAELSGYNGLLTFMTNGFSINTTDNSMNNSSGNYIFMAIAANPDTTAPTKANSFKTKLFTPTTSSSALSVTGFGFKPDFVWAKYRGTGSGYALQSHYLYDTVRGINSRIFSNTNAAESTANYVQSFDSDGITYVNNLFNRTGTNSCVAWGWKALDHDRNLAAINTDGNIPSIVSANPEAGFSIVTYSPNNTVGMSIGHGLSQAPSIVFTKRLDTSQDWGIYTNATTGNTTTNWLSLNDNDAYGAGSFMTLNPTTLELPQTGAFWASPSSNQVAYCFHSVPAYSKVAYYTGTGSAFNVTLGFTPGWVLIKRADGAGSWTIFDNQRSNGFGLSPDDNYGSASGGYDYSSLIQLSGTGAAGKIEHLGASGTLNTAGDRYIYLAFSA